MRAGVAVLDIEHRVLARLLDHLGEVEVEHGVVLAIEHHETHGVAADFVDDLAQRHEISGALRHFHRFARTQQLDQLDDLDVEIGAPVGDRPHGGRFLRPHRRALAVALAGTLAQSLLALPAPLLQGFALDQLLGPRPDAAPMARLIAFVLAASLACHLGRLALGWGQASLIDQPFGTQLFDRGLHRTAVAPRQRPLGKKDVMMGVEHGEVAADLVHHHVDRAGAHDRQPLRLRLVPQRRTVLGGKRFADRPQIFAGIKAFRDWADRLAERFAVAQVR